MWDDQSYIETFIKAAIKSNQPPTAVILSDPTHTEWDFWDYRLIKAYHLKQGMMSGNFPVWLDREENVWFEAKSFVSQSEKVVARAEEIESKREHAEHGKRFYAIIKGTRNGQPLPTMRDYLAKQAGLDVKHDEPPREEWMDKPIQGVDW